MPRHTLKPLSRQFRPTRPGLDGHGTDQSMWETLDRVQVLGGTDGGGHTGCVNALSWSEDGQTLLSGSDDRRLCIWQPDASPLPNTISPHPLKLSTMIKTGHRNNIFSAKFLPHANTPTIVSVAGDRDIRVFDVERLGRSEETSENGESWDVLDGTGAGAAGVRTLQCHKSRVKRIATENSPSLFLTVSEDGTVRQHDLRLPHSCSAGFCPEVLFNAPKGVDLYSLSVSPVMPWMFTVAGTAEHALVCDRRMTPSSSSSSWGPNTRSDGQVHCVRRLGLPNEEWERVLPGRRRFGGDRHISSVRMSGERGDEVAVAFMKHSTSLFSTYDSPYSSSAKSPNSSPILSPNENAKRTKNNADKSVLGKRPTSSRSLSPPPPSANPGSYSRPAPASTTRNEEPLSAEEIRDLRVLPLPPGEPQPEEELDMEPMSPGLQDFYEGVMEEAANMAEERDQRNYVSVDTFDDNGNLIGGEVFYREGDEESSNPNPESSSRPAPASTTRNEEPLSAEEIRDLRVLPLPPGEPQPDEEFDMEPMSPGLQDFYEGVMEEAAIMAEERDQRNYFSVDTFDDNGNLIGGEVFYREGDEESSNRELLIYSLAKKTKLINLPKANSSHLHNLADDFLQRPVAGPGHDDSDEDDYSSLDDDDDFDMFDEDAYFDADEEDEDFFGSPIFGFPFGAHASTAAKDKYDSVDVVHPVRSFFGALNTETVKDCNFLGVRSDKIASGSDDGHFMVWDKDTGRLEGVWEGDGAIVNMIEQHPTLPLIASSGIDSTIKLFSPLHHRPHPQPSFNRSNRGDEIVERNSRVPRFVSGGGAGDDLFAMLLSRGIVVE
ncbi:hypothetical protein L198_07714 [Cryptococcus wingfieldii CBS 7118]|uniref:WD-repeat protein n=1 Tax=Cryptococcus wingfieldii CBS 7118 TaxID=1295528 RepID=A0A1E3I1K3_9TREE|nr:hypothetical protein L198_07714 [Cryptococcus wingfieldii CBS 7118]ODN82492.1 hypothetical protein L198_07714 [Cryptococcus wingfieldii CBS 7118]